MKRSIDPEERMEAALREGDRLERQLRWGEPFKRPPSKLYKENYDSIRWRKA